MPYAFFYDVPSDERMYERVKTEIGEDQPEGLLLHLVVKSESGLRHINVWESREQWERFADERVMPAVANAARGRRSCPAPSPTRASRDGNGRHRDQLMKAR